MISHLHRLLYRKLDGFINNNDFFFALKKGHPRIMLHYTFESITILHSETTSYTTLSLGT